MAVQPDGPLETISFVLTKDQIRRIRALQGVQSSGHRRVSLSDIAREVVEEGLEVISRGQNIAFAASRPGDEEAA